MYGDAEISGLQEKQDTSTNTYSYDEKKENLLAAVA